MLILRIGLTLHDLSFDGKSNFYRLSLAEMFVPYGDPRNPIYRKGAFDLGNVGAGATANDLQRESYPELVSFVSVCLALHYMS